MAKAKKQYFGEETAAAPKRKYTRRAKAAAPAARKMKRKTRGVVKAPRAERGMVMIPVPAHLAFQIGLQLGRHINE